MSASRSSAVPPTPVIIENFLRHRSKVEASELEGVGGFEAESMQAVAEGTAHAGARAEFLPVAAPDRRTGSRSSFWSEAVEKCSALLSGSDM